jgi:hypothetical protein
MSAQGSRLGAQRSGSRRRSRYTCVAPRLRPPDMAEYGSAPLAELKRSHAHSPCCATTIVMLRDRRQTQKLTHSVCTSDQNRWPFVLASARKCPTSFEIPKAQTIQPRILKGLDRRPSFLTARPTVTKSKHLAPTVETTLDFTVFDR